MKSFPRKDDLNTGDDSDNGDDSKIGNDSLLQVIGAGPAGLILQATGFTHKLPRIERDGRAIKLGEPTRNGELRDLDSGEIVAGCYGMGLGFNILPDREPRGEPSFNGGIHGFQSYPLAIAPPIVDRLIANLPREASS